MCVGRVVSKTMQNGTFLCFRSAVFLHLLYYKYNSQWQGKTKRLRTGGGESGGWGTQVGRERGHGMALKGQEGELLFLCNGFISARLK